MVGEEVVVKVSHAEEKELYMREKKGCPFSMALWRDSLSWFMVYTIED